MTTYIFQTEVPHLKYRNGQEVKVLEDEDVGTEWATVSFPDGLTVTVLKTEIIEA